MEAGFEALYNTYYMQVYSFVLGLSRNRSLAEEITQETFFRAMTTAERHRSEASEITWLCAIAKNLLTDAHRKQAKTCELGAEIPSCESVESAVVDGDATFRIHLALHALSEPYKEVFQLRVFGELSFAKIGLLFNKTETWARVTYHRARLKLQERMEEP